MHQDSGNNGNDGTYDQENDSLPCGVLLSAARPPRVTYESALAAAWPQVVPVVLAELRRFRLPGEVVDDLLQATAEVVLRKRPFFQGPDDLAPYARIVARRKALHWCRDTAKETVGLPDMEAKHSVADAARLRLLAEGTLRAYSRLDEDQRDRLTRYLAGERATGAAERARERKRIERIRTQMAKAIERIAAFGGGWRRFADMAVRPEVAAAAAVAFLQAMSALFPGSPPAQATVAAGERPAGMERPAVASSAPAPHATPQASAPPVAPAARTPRPAAPPPTIPQPVPDRSPVVRIQSPTGNENGVNTRPNSPQKPLACLSGFVNMCVDKPFTL